jgi:hypothetical protein
MTTNNVFAWSGTAGSNADVAGNGITGSSNISLGNDVFQNIMAQITNGMITRGSDIATASTVDFTAATTPSLLHDLTGTTTVTAVTMTAGWWRLCRAQGAFQLTASSTLVVNGSTSTNYTTTAGDLLIFFGYSASTVRVWTFTGGATGAATTSTAGTVKLATNAQAEVGTDTAAALTSSNLAALLNAGTDNSGGATITMGDGGYFNLITSTTAITAFAFTNDAVGRTARIRFNTVRTLTYNATSLIIPGAANLTTAVGDIMQIRSLGSGNFVVEWYTPAAATPSETIVTPWVAYTPTFTGFGTVTSISIFSRRVGDSLEIMGNFTVGTSTAVEARVTLGFNGTGGNVTSDATKVPNIRLAGYAVFSVVTANQNYPLIESNVGYITFGITNGSAAGLSKQNGSTIISSAIISINARIPISGW